MARISRRSLVMFTTGAVFAAIVFAPLAGAFGALFWFTGVDAFDARRDNDRIAERIIETVLLRRPDWIPRGIMLGQGARWPVPAVSPDGDCLPDVAGIAVAQRVAVIDRDGGVPARQFPSDLVREWLDRELRIARRAVVASDLDLAMLRFDRETSMPMVELVERSALLDMPNVSLGALDGCVHGSLAAPLCARFARDRIEHRLARYRAPLQTLFLANGARVQNMACAALHGLRRRIASNARRPSPARQYAP